MLEKKKNTRRKTNRKHWFSKNLNVSLCLIKLGLRETQIDYDDETSQLWGRVREVSKTR